ncbi:hypothetical protein QQ045_001847 [Rhodiola kirilowii]
MSCFKVRLMLCRKLSGEFIKFKWHNKKNRSIHWLRAEYLFNERWKGGLGFRKLELMNLALLAKQRWRILTEPNMLVSKILKAKYFPDSDLLNAAVGSRPSFAWRGIMEAVKIIKYGAERDESDDSFH